MKHILSCSGGKDSVATLLLAKQNGEPLDEVVYCEVMFDKETSGEIPEHRDFVYHQLKPFVENKIGVPFTILQSQKTYVDYFKHIITRGEHKGLTAGFPIPGMCAINRDCKIPPIQDYWKRKGEDVVQYVGIAIDEPERLVRLGGTNKISLMQKYNVEESMAFQICRKENMLSPIYNISDRNGCWFCMNCSDAEWAHMIFNHEDVFDKLIQLEEAHPARYRKCLTRAETARELKERIIKNGQQLSFY